MSGIEGDLSLSGGLEGTYEKVGPPILTGDHGPGMLTLNL